MKFIPILFSTPMVQANLEDQEKEKKKKNGKIGILQPWIESTNGMIK